MLTRYALLVPALLALSASAQPLPDTLRTPVEADSIISYGWTVDADADRVLVGARIWPWPPTTGVRADHMGTVFVHRRQEDGEWEPEGRLESDYIGVEDCFSWSLDLREDRAVVGAECESGFEGSVYLYRHDGTEWMRDAKLTPSDIESDWDPWIYFGESVSLGEDFVVVGAARTPNPSDPEADEQSGAAYVFDRNQNGTWSYAATLVNDDTDELQNEFFGATVAVVGEEVLVGTVGSSAKKALYVFGRTEGGWEQRQKLFVPASSPALMASQGTSAVVGSQFSPSLYPLDTTGDSWSVGTSLELQDNPMAVARYGDRVLAADDEGMGYLFTRNGDAWSESTFPIPVAGWYRDEIVSLTEQHAFIGRSTPDDDSGYVVIYDLGQMVANETDVEALSTLRLSVAPNPAADGTTIRFDLPRAAKASVVIYDLLGREVSRLADGQLPAGPQALPLDTRTLTAGTYLVTLQSEQERLTQLLSVVQ